MSLNMSVAEREAFLADLHVGVVSIARDGRGPLTVPIWYDYTPGGNVWMLTGPASLKGKALNSVSRISLCAQTETPPYRYVSVEGTFSLRTPENGELEAMAIRYLGEERGKAYAEGSSGHDDIVVELTPENWLTIDYGKM
jgi:nitroimidazol reductase NimA-like FMN-containing flavoprotein (pyridoxamine 5'-phosphate oxidase superfamily)